ncbi:MAG: amino acid permease [Clostridiales Family XIII bacterium]|jgi:lysine-specific permease|nr:amino acid permease [Clostridiales Family XIII bacterium]
MSNENSGDLQRGLKGRHVQMIAIGGAIGTGLFVALGGSLSAAGPGGALVAYGAIGVMVFFLMTSLGEMSTYMPVTGSFETYATKFVDPSLGFALGWNYWYNWAITVAAELEASVIVIKFWRPEMSVAEQMGWSLLFLAVLFFLNFFSVGSYGESEFWFAGIKVVAIIIFLIVGVLSIIGILGGNSPGTANWHVADAPFPGGFPAIIGIFMIAGFSFQGTELIGVASGEVKNPAKAIPKAIRTVFFRIILFYIGAIIVIGFLIPYNDPNLLSGGVENIAVSPFTLVFERAGILGAATIMNAVILTSILSCGNSGMYASTRMLYSMAVEGKAPKLFTKVNKGGVPIAALILTTLVGGAVFLGSLFGAEKMYIMLVNCSGVAGFIAWLGVAISHYKFRKAFIAQGHSLDELQYKSKLFPFGPLFALALCLIVIIGQFFASDAGEVMGAIIGASAVVALYIIHKIVKKTKLVKAEEADLTQGFASQNPKDEPLERL